MGKTVKQPIKIAILDLYDGLENEAINNFQQILQRYQTKNNLELRYEIFEVRQKCEMPGPEFDIYLFSGGPGSPLDTEGSEWEKRYFDLIAKLEQHNQSDSPQKKYAFFVCHSFQLMCRHYKLGHINERNLPSFGILPVNKIAGGLHEPSFKNLTDPFYIVDSRLWQVINPDEKRFTDLGMQLLAIEKEHADPEQPRALMAVRYSDYFIGTQFHPEADADSVKALLLKPEKKKEVIDEHRRDRYNEMLEQADDPGILTHTQNTMIPNFLDVAIANLPR